MSLITQIIGAVYLIYRIWVCEFHLKPLLRNRTYDLSRFLAYYFGAMLIFDVKSIMINAVIIGAMPDMILSFFTLDLMFFRNIHKQPEFKKIPPFQKVMLYTERITLHIPLASFGIYTYLTGVLNYVNFSKGVLPFFGGLLLLFIPFLFFDRRWKNKEDWPTGKFIFIGCVLSSIWLVVYISLWHFYFPWISPLF